jgi:hypothetical protein
MRRTANFMAKTILPSLRYPKTKGQMRQCVKCALVTKRESLAALRLPLFVFPGKRRLAPIRSAYLCLGCFLPRCSALSERGGLFCQPLTLGSTDICHRFSSHSGM